jgi:glycosyltransferase involved in cell wall biosynthesis
LNYNKENYIKRCLNSCVNQSYKNIEIIFVDNLSNDNSLKIAKDFKNIKVLSTKVRSKYPALNQIDTLLTGIKFCKGKIVSLLDSDDFFKSFIIFTPDRKCGIVCFGGSFGCALCLEVCEEAHGVRVVTVSDI